MGQQDLIVVAWDRRGNLLLRQDRLHEGDHELRVSRDYFPQLVRALDVLREVIVDAIRDDGGLKRRLAPSSMQTARAGTNSCARYAGAGRPMPSRQLHHRAWQQTQWKGGNEGDPENRRFGAGMRAGGHGRRALQKKRSGRGQA